MYKEDLALNNLRWFTCNKTQPNQTKPNLSKWSDSFICTKDWNLTGTTKPGQSGPESNANEGVIDTTQRSGTWATPSNAILCRIQDTQSVFYQRDWPSATAFLHLQMELG